jgi:hypothetical protein
MKGALSSRDGAAMHSEQPDEPDEARVQVGLRDTCVVVGAFGSSILVSGLLFVAMLWVFQMLAR